jgi:hypothetical protein
MASLVADCSLSVFPNINEEGSSATEYVTEDVMNGIKLSYVEKKSEGIKQGFR